MRTAIVGLGNPLLTDDAAGVIVARQLKESLVNHPEVNVAELPAGGLRLLDAVAGYDKVVIIDAMVPVTGKPGTLHRLSFGELGDTWNTLNLHDLDLPTALALGRMVDIDVPADITVWGIEGSDMETFGEKPTREVAEALPGLIERVCTDLGLQPK